MPVRPIRLRLSFISTNEIAVCIMKPENLENQISTLLSLPENFEPSIISKYCTRRKIKARQHNVKERLTD